VGNGPFTLDQWIMNRILTVKKNRSYWDAKRVRLNEIRFYPIQNAGTEERMFRTGQLHVTDHVPTEKIAVYRKRNPQVLHISSYLGTYFYRFNTTVKPLDDARVRRALAMCIDRRAIVTDITRGGQAPAFNLTPPGLNGYSADARIPYDVDAARRLMADAGHANGRGVPALELAFNTSEQNLRIAVAIQGMWKQALNVDVALTNQDWKVFLDRDTRLDYQIHRGSWIGDYLDPTTFLGMFSSGGGNNRTGWNSVHYDALLRRAARSPDQARRYALLGRAESILMTEAPIAPIYFYTSVRLISRDVRGWDPNLLDRHPYKYIYLEHSTHV
jgi:oligopeptide transport system substrate-binding protein